MTSQNKKIDIVRNILLLFIFFAVCGWIYEVIWTYFDDGVWTNRGFLFGPWLPIYGFGGMLIYGIFRKQIKKPLYIGKLNIRFILLFVYICLVTTVVELAATYIIELFGTPFTVLWGERTLRRSRSDDHLRCASPLQQVRCDEEPEGSEYRGVDDHRRFPDRLDLAYPLR